ncbi:MAG: 16S rRNA (cytosine(1402)-N(4))-methyltransferase RsmH [Candidatus Eremiobacteraeota bacterium]|nr:16S rRNA (cytosine(1402)-N(4))-methyltransferase RsmH [Candidatus Eremiobacteraeota bacterium]
MDSNPFHVPVMPDEVLAYLSPRRGGIYVDCTIGGGGHSLRILEVLGPDGMLVGIDQDPEAVEEITGKFHGISTVRIVHANFAQLEEILERERIKEVDGVLFDLGVSSHQLDSIARGFSFRAEARLDMRMNSQLGTTASDLVNRLSVKELERIFWEYGNERWARRIARRIETIRRHQPIHTTLELARCVEACVPGERRKRTLHPATKVFMALRIAVNREMQCLHEGLEAAIRVTRSGGTIVVISYHSLEDRMVKTKFRELSREVSEPFTEHEVGLPKKRLSILTRKPLVPKAQEVARNPRARSAKLRAVKVEIKEVNK